MAIDWPKLEAQFAHPERLQFWLNELTSQQAVELNLIAQARSGQASLVQVQAIFSGIASLLGDKALQQACEQLQEGANSQPLDIVEQCYRQLLEQIQQYQQQKLTS